MSYTRFVLRRLLDMLQTYRYFMRYAPILMVWIPIVLYVCFLLCIQKYIFYLFLISFSLHFFHSFLILVIILVFFFLFHQLNILLTTIINCYQMFKKCFKSNNIQMVKIKVLKKSKVLFSMVQNNLFGNSCSMTSQWHSCVIKYKIHFKNSLTISTIQISICMKSVEPLVPLIAFAWVNNTRWPNVPQSCQWVILICVKNHNHESTWKIFAFQYWISYDLYVTV